MYKREQHAYSQENPKNEQHLGCFQADRNQSTISSEAVWTYSGVADHPRRGYSVLRS